MDTRQIINVGQEVISQDLNKYASRIEKGVFDYMAYYLMNQKTNAFFQDSFKAIYTGAYTAQVGLGLGFQTLIADVSEPTRQPVFKAANKTMTFDIADNSNDRIDIICVKAALVDSEIETRKFKDEFTEEITTQEFVVSKKWDAEIIITKGTPSGIPATPDTPAGYIKTSEHLIKASVGMADQNDITDKRVLLPYCVTTNQIGNNEYDAIVGDMSIEGVTHGDSKTCLDNALDGWKILLTKSETINITPEILNNNIELVFKRGVTLSKGTASVGLKLSGNDCLVKGARLSGFSAGGDKGMQIATDKLRNEIVSCRFANCDTNIEDLGTDTFINYEIQE